MNRPEIIEPLYAEALLRVEGMHCINCVRKLERALGNAGAEVDVNLVGGTAELRWAGSSEQVGHWIEVIADAGFKASPLTGAAVPSADDERGSDDVQAGETRVDPTGESRGMLLRIGIAALLGMQIMMLASTQYFVGAENIDDGLLRLIRHAQWWLATPALLYCGAPFLSSAWSALRQRMLTMDVTVSAALVLAYGASVVATLRNSGHVYFDSVSMFVLLLLTARWFEGRGRAIATRRLHELAAAQPNTARREAGSGVEEVAIDALRIGDVVIVAAGVAVPADGQLLDQAAPFDEALLTGESTPLQHAVGDPICSGAINVGRSAVRLRVTRVGAEGTLSQLTRMVHRAQAQRARAVHLADRIAGVVLFGVVALAALAFVIWLPQGVDRAFGVALSVLAVTCPCALSLATPAALAAASSALARRGVLVANVDALLTLPSVARACFDKTGTLTDGRMQVSQIEAVGLTDADQALAIAAALERDVRHPIAHAFAAHDGGLLASDVHVEAGHGPAGTVEGQSYQLVADERPDDARGLSWIGLMQGGRPIARFGLAQGLRADAGPTIEALQRAGLVVEMLSGDAKPVVESTAQRLGIGHWRARLSPQDKLDHLRGRQASGERVWMIGDGLNDAPVLAAADVSTSLASASALSQSRADVLLLNDRLEGVVVLRDTALRTRAVVRENLTWAAVYNLIGIPLALSGLVTPWLASLGMGLSSLIVVANALRLARSREPEGRAAEYREQPA